ncbi:hypothetical protein FACS189426_05930 [Bacteroidia bacterium]|nr:hypothetical protein FACS189426_05930 [Bacteroidia bacterium]GHV70781.1 hypothetical protein FACS189420_3300 [Bacteroidia bacterium]
MTKINFKSLLICCLCFAGISCTSGSAQQQETTEIEAYSGLDNADLSLIPVKQDGKCGYINLKGEYVIKPQFADADYFREGLAWVKSADGKVGYIGKDGNYVIAAEYAHGTPFSEGLAFVMSPNGSVPVCIDTKGNAKFTLSQATSVNPFYKGFAQLGNPYSNSYSDTLQYVDKSGKVISVPRVNKWQQDNEDYIERFGEGLYPFSDNNNKYGYRNKKGETVINPQFDDADTFSEGLAPVKIGDKIGFIDKKGKIVINPQFDRVLSCFSEEGLALVALKNRHYSYNYALIDRTGQLVISDLDGKLICGVGVRGVSKDVYIIAGNNKSWLIDKKGHILAAPDAEIEFGREDWETFMKTQEPMILLQNENNGKWGFMDVKGNVITPQFDAVSAFREGLATVRVGDWENGKWGVIDKTGKYVINPQFVGFPFLLSDKVIISIDNRGECSIMNIQNKTVVNNLKFDDINPNYRGGIAGFHIPNDFRYVGEMEAIDYSMFSREGHYQ